jgi:hypothetical protein
MKKLYCYPFKNGSPMARMKTFIVLLERTLFTSWKTCLSRNKNIFYFFFISVSNMRFKIILL